MLASFNHGNQFKDALPLLGLAFVWLTAVVLALVALACVWTAGGRQRIWRLAVATCLLTAVAIIVLVRLRGFWNLDSNDWLVTFSPAASALGLALAGSWWSRRAAAGPARPASERTS